MRKEKNTKRGPESRREVQRRFPPGTMFVNSGGRRIATIVGWAPSRDGWRKVQSWSAIIIRDQRVTVEHWEHMREAMTLDEWEDYETTP